MPAPALLPGAVLCLTLTLLSLALIPLGVGVVTTFWVLTGVRAFADDRPPANLTPREAEVLELMAQGRSNAAMAGQLAVTERAIARHTSNIFGKLGLEVSDDDNRRVLAVLAYLDRDR